MPAPAPFAAKAMLQYVAGLVAGLSGIQQASIGVPEALDSRVSSFVTIGDLTPVSQPTQQARREPQVLVTFAYRVGGDESAAELLICDLVDELTAAVYADRSLGGTSQSALLDMRMNAQPTYMSVAGSEFRRYAVLITGLQTTAAP